MLPVCCAGSFCLVTTTAEQILLCIHATQDVTGHRSQLYNLSAGGGTTSLAVVIKHYMCESQQSKRLCHHPPVPSAELSEGKLQQACPVCNSRSRHPDIEHAWLKSCVKLQETLEAFFSNSGGQEVIFTWRAIGGGLVTLLPAMTYSLRVSCCVGPDGSSTAQHCYLLCGHLCCSGFAPPDLVNQSTFCPLCNSASSVSMICFESLMTCLMMLH